MRPKFWRLDALVANGSTLAANFSSLVIPPVLPDPMVWVDAAGLVATMAVFSRPIGNNWRQSKFSYPRNVVAETLGGFTL